MLYFPEGSGYYRIFSIDPGTDHLGTAVIDVDLDSLIPKVVYVNTFRPRYLHPQIVETFGERKAKQEFHRNNLREMFIYFQPHCIISESPYLGKFVDAFAALVELLAMFREVVSEYDFYMTLETVDPTHVKKAVGAPGRGNDKDIVKHSLLKLRNLVNESGCPYSLLDSHSVDAIAVGCYKVNTLFDNIL